MTNKLEITHKFEKNEFWATPIWKADFDNIDNIEIEDHLKEVKFSEHRGLLLESTDTPIVSYSSIMKEAILSFYSIDFDPFLIKIKDFKPKFYICKPNGCSSLEHNCMNDQGQEHDVCFMYFIKVPKEKIPTVSFRDPRSLILANSFFYKKNNLNNGMDLEFEPSEGTALVFPSYLQSKINVNLSNEDLIYFKSDMSLVTAGDITEPPEFNE